MDLKMLPCQPTSYLRQFELLLKLALRTVALLCFLERFIGRCCFSYAQLHQLCFVRVQALEVLLGHKGESLCDFIEFLEIVLHFNDVIQVALPDCFMLHLLHSTQRTHLLHFPLLGHQHLEQSLGLHEVPAHGLPYKMLTFSSSSMSDSWKQAPKRQSLQRWSKQELNISSVACLKGNIDCQLQSNTKICFICASSSQLYQEIATNKRRSVSSSVDACKLVVPSLSGFYQYYYQMSKSLKLVIRNSKQHPLSDYPTRRETLTPLSKPSGPIDLTERMNMLQGNLRMLEKRYRANLKEGFDNKIKAYRLQAVVERKLLKEAIEETQRAHQREQIMEKIEINERQRKLDESRALIAHYQKEERLKFIKMRNIKQKRSLSLTSHQRKAQLEKQLREAHDKIVEQQANINRKKEYFDFIRRANLKKEELEQKKEILQKIMGNTERLKDLKYTLEDLRSSDRENTFITM